MEILKSQVDDDHIAELVQTISEVGRWPGINYVDLSNTGFEHANHLKNTLNMSVAFNTVTSEFYQSKEISELIIRSLPLAHLLQFSYLWGIKIGGIAAKIGLVVGDEAEFEQIMKVINNEIKFTTGNMGMQHDYSFHHRVDRVNTTYSYGGGYADNFPEWAACVKGTKYAFPEEKLRQLVDYYFDGI